MCVYCLIYDAELTFGELALVLVTCQVEISNSNDPSSDTANLIQLIDLFNGFYVREKKMCLEA